MSAFSWTHPFAKTLQGYKSRLVTLQARPHAIHFKPILDFREGQVAEVIGTLRVLQREGQRANQG
jgi:hypothetical protein